MPSRKRVLNVSYEALGGDLHGLAVHRAALFEVLFGKVRERNITLLTNAEIRGLTHRDTGVSLIDTFQNEHGAFELIVDASGASSNLHDHASKPVHKRPLSYGAIWGTFDWPGSISTEAVFRPNFLEQRYVGAHRMVGVLPIGRHDGTDRDQVAFFWSLRSADYAAWLADGLDAWKEQVLSIWPETHVILDQIKDPAQMTMARYGHHTLALPYGDRIAFIGDAAHATSPQLGQGANMALLDAWALGTAIENSSSVTASLSRYAKLRRSHVRFFQFASLALTPFYQSDSKSIAWLRDQLFDPISRLPVVKRIVAGLISGLLGNPLRALGLNQEKQ